MRRAPWLNTREFYKDGKLRDTAREFLKELFLEHIHREPESDCWWFTWGTANAGGYKDIWWNSKKMLARRFAYQLWKGEIPEGLNVLHNCDAPPCCNPDHLHVGTDADNMADRVRRGRWRGNNWDKKTHCPQGHEYSPENTYVFENRRYCRTCHKKYSLRWARGHKEQKRDALRRWRASRVTTQRAFEGLAPN